MQAFKKILVAVDTQSASMPELERAMQLAEQSGGSLHIVDSVRDLNMAARLMPQWLAAHEKLGDEKRAALAQLAERCQQAGVAATSELLHGNYSQQLLQVIEQREIDLLIRSAKGTRSIEQGAIGSTSSQLLRRAPCALWLTQGDHAAGCLRIVATVDATPGDEAHARLNAIILDRCFDLAQREGCELHILYVWDVFDSELLQDRMPQSEFDQMIESNRVGHEESFQRLLSQNRSAHDMSRVNAKVHLVRGQPTLAIPEFCRIHDADLLVCGTVARSGISGMMIGNTANRMLSRVPCSILALRPQ